MRNALLINGILASLMLVSACDGGSSNNSSSKGNGNEPPPVEPPPVAVQTGYLVDAGASGVSYMTPTHNGMTDIDGAFHYAPGETVSFTIGHTLLGEVTGKAEVTPFDLAGSEPLTGTPTITRALNRESAPFHAVINIAVLLQSLDQDAEPDNGIEITPEVSSLFQGVSLDVRQHWQTFERDAALQQVLAQANEQDLFDQPRRAVIPAAALQHLYDSRGIDARTHAVSLSERYGTAAAGYEYDSEGYLKRVALPHWHMDGDDAKEYMTQAYGYDERGRRTRLEEQRYSEMEIDLGGGPLLFKGLDIFIESRDHTAFGDIARVERWSGGYSEVLPPVFEPQDPVDNPTEKVEDWRYQYDAKGRIKRVEASFPQEKKLCVTVYQYDLEDRLVLVEMEGDFIDTTAAALGIPGIEYLYLAGSSGGTYSVAYEYDAEGFLNREVRAGVSPTYGQSVETLHYDTTGKVTDHEARTTSDFFPDPREIVSKHHYEYDDRGNQVSQSTDHNEDGVPDQLEHWEYDDRGNQVGYSTDNNGDGVPEWLERREYDDYGNLTREELDTDGDGAADVVSQWEYDDDGYLVREDLHGWHQTSYQYAPAGWGHLFTPPPPDFRN